MFFLIFGLITHPISLIRLTDSFAVAIKSFLQSIDRSEFIRCTAEALSIRRTTAVRSEAAGLPHGCFRLSGLQQRTICAGETRPNPACDFLRDSPNLEHFRNLSYMMLHVDYLTHFRTTNDP